MLKYKRLEVDEVIYEELKEIQITNKTPIQEHFIGSRKKLYANSEIIATISHNTSLDIGKISNNKFYAFLGQFNKQLYKQFLTNPDLHYLDVDFQGVSKSKNFEVWDKLKNEEYFYNLDLQSAYWQVANKLGYLNNSMYQRYLDVDDYKQAKRYCISFLARTNKKVYLTDEFFMTITCDTSSLKQVYQNIRHFLYVIINNAAEMISDHIEYNIDGVTVQTKDLKLLKKYFNENDLKYKITECKKIDDNYYLYGSRQRKFKNR